MKHLYSFLIAVFCLNASAQCPAGNIILATQADVDAFAVNYPACGAITGDLTVSGSGINNLSGLSQIASVGGSVTIYLCNSLQNLNGLNNLTSIGGNLDLTVNTQLTNITALGNLQTIGGSLIFNNDPAITSLIGLDNLTSVGNLLSIKGTGIVNCVGLGNLASVGFFFEISNNPALTSLESLSSLTTIGGYIEMQNNPQLTTLTGLDNISPASITSILIRNCTNLSFCSVQSFCVFLTSIGGGTFQNNAFGCNSQSQITSVCNLGVKQVRESEISIYPNPVGSILNLNVGKSTIESYSIIDASGKMVQRSSVHSNTLDVSVLHPGIYFLSIYVDGLVLNTKFVKQ